MPDTPHETGGDPGTPIYDAVLGDRLQAAALAVARAGQDAADFRSALDRGQDDALEQLAVRRARELVEAQTRAVTAQRDQHEREARTAGDRLAGLAAWHSGDPTCRACREAMPCTTTRVLAGAPVPVQAPAPEPAPPAPPRPAVPTLESQAVATVQSREVAPDAEALASPPAASGRPAAPARDGGPAASDVPSVPSMKELFSSTRAAGWLDSLLGGVKR